MSTTQDPLATPSSWRTRVHAVPCPRGHRSALIVVNVQNDYTDPRGPVVIPGGEVAVPLINLLRSKVGWDVIALSQDNHPGNHSSFYSTHVDNPTAQIGQSITLNGRRQLMLETHCVVGTPGAESYHGLTVEPTDFLVRTGEQTDVNSRSAFCEEDGSATPLTRVLRFYDVTDVYVLGMGTAVSLTAVDAVKNGFQTFYVKDASCSATSDAENVARIRMEGKGVQVVSSAQLIKPSQHPRQQAADYLSTHRVLPLFERLTSLLVFHKPADPRAFLHAQLSAMQNEKGNSEKKMAVVQLLDEKDLDALFKLMDPANSGYVTKGQARQAFSDMRALSPEVQATLEPGQEKEADRLDLAAFKALGLQGLRDT